MTDSLQINIDVPIGSVNMLDESELPPSSNVPETDHEPPEQHEEKLKGICKALAEATQRIGESCEQIFTSNQEQIVRLSIQIAEKILLNQVSSGNYDIEKIITEALKIAPAQQNVIVRINPDDLAQYEKSKNKLPENINLIADPGIGPAECVVETNKGMIEYFIDEKLKKITEALEGAK